MSAFGGAGGGGGGGGAPEPRNMREVIQRKLLTEVIGSTSTWKVLVLDDASTRIISSVLTMYDIMEQRVTIVEQLKLGRQPFPEMEVIYFISPTMESVKRVVADFNVPRGKQVKYGNVHLFFTDTLSDALMAELQTEPQLIARIRTLKEISMEFLAVEANAFHFDMKDSLTSLYGSSPDRQHPDVLAKKLATLCISLNEHPCIRYQGTSRFASAIANGLHSSLQAYKRANPSVMFNGDDAHGDRERAQILILDRTFDPLTPAMHEYTYQCMAYDLLEVQGDNVISYISTNNKGQESEKQAILGEQDELWVEFRHQHIAKVIESVRARLTDILQNSSQAKMAQKKGGSDLTITEMGSAVKGIQEYQQTTDRLTKHIALAQQCMNIYSKGNNLLHSVSQCEQTIVTGVDDDGTEVKGAALIKLVSDTFALRGITSEQKLRLLAIFFISQRTASEADKRALLAAAGVREGADRQLLTNLDTMCASVAPPREVAAAQASKGGGGFFSRMFGTSRAATKHAATAEGSYTDTRHVGILKGLLEQLLQSELPTDRFPAMGPTISSTSEAKAGARSMRRFGANQKWGNAAAKTQLSGGRYIVFVAGGVAYSEMRTAYELQGVAGKEVIIGGSHFITPEAYIENVRSVAPP